MDITVKAAGDGTKWELIDLLGRSMGTITKSGSEFTIVLSDHAIKTTKLLARGTYTSLDMALAEIEKHTRGTCRLDGSR
jgi:hypothetical protein